MGDGGEGAAGRPQLGEERGETPLDVARAFAAGRAEVETGAAARRDAGGARPGDRAGEAFPGGPVAFDQAPVDAVGAVQDLGCLAGAPQRAAEPCGIGKRGRRAQAAEFGNAIGRQRDVGAALHTAVAVP